MARERIDEAMVARGLCESIEKARALVMAGRVYLGENKVTKPSDAAKPGLPVSVRGMKQPFVSRGGLKLQKALEAFRIDMKDRVCIDVGASTGGFTDAMLQAGAKYVYAVDVGYGQLDWKLRSDERVCVMERTNARFLLPEQFDPKPSFGATDVSFISLKAILPAALNVLSGEDKERRFVALIKPQFEAPAEKVGAKGVVRDKEVHEEVILSLVEFVESIKWRAIGLDFSPITGPEGNIEFVMDIVPAEVGRNRVDERDIHELVVHAYDKFVKSI